MRDYLVNDLISRLLLHAPVIHHIHHPVVSLTEYLPKPPAESSPREVVKGVIVFFTPYGLIPATSEITMTIVIDGFFGALILELEGVVGHAIG